MATTIYTCKYCGQGSQTSFSGNCGISPTGNHSLLVHTERDYWDDRRDEKRDEKQLDALKELTKSKNTSPVYSGGSSNNYVGSDSSSGGIPEGLGWLILLGTPVALVVGGFFAIGVCANYKLLNHPYREFAFYYNYTFSLPILGAFLALTLPWKLIHTTHGNLTVVLKLLASAGGLALSITVFYFYFKLIFKKWYIGVTIIFGPLLLWTLWAIYKWLMK